MIERASRAFDLLDGLGDDEISPWDRTLRAVAFEALDEGERAHVCHMRDGLDALRPYADATPNEEHEETPDDAA